jgi:hypothetical protein
MSHTRTSSFPFAARVSVGVLLLVAAVILLVQRRAATAPSITTASSAPQASAPPPSPAPLSASAEARRARDAMRDQILETLRKQAASAPPRPAPASPRASTSNAESAPPKGHYEPEYIQQVFREEMFPLLRKCYEGALARKPTLAGRLVLTFRIIGDPSVTLTFDKPPSGGGEVTVKYPVMFSPGDDDDDDGGAPANKPDSSR